MIDPLVNYGKTPLVTTVVVTHPGDIKLLPRALASLRGQLPLGQLEVLVMHDGPINKEGQKLLEELPLDYDFALEVSSTPEHSGYYCVARNRSMELARGLYISHMDADNEYGPNHLRALLEALRVPDPESGWPHFAYTRRMYVIDEGALPSKYWFWDQGEAGWRCHGYTSSAPYPEPPPWNSPSVPRDNFWNGLPVEPQIRHLVEGPSPLREWTPQNVGQLLQAPVANFIDTGDMLIPRSVLFRLADLTGFVWNTECRRYGDYDLVTRMIGCNFRGRAVDQATNIYHWTGNNLQLTRGLSEIQVIPANVYEKLKAEGKML